MVSEEELFKVTLGLVSTACCKEEFLYKFTSVPWKWQLTDNYNTCCSVKFHYYQGTFPFYAVRILPVLNLLDLCNLFPP